MYMYSSPYIIAHPPLPPSLPTPRPTPNHTPLAPVPCPAGCSSSGLSPDELGASLATLGSLATCCAADATVLRQRRSEEGRVAEVLVRRKVGEEDFLEVR